MVFKAFWPWIPCLHRARSILEPASVLRRGLSAAFCVICNILSRVSFWIFLKLVRVYLGDQRMRRVKDQDEEGKGPGDQEDPGTRGPGDQRTRGPKDQGNLTLFFQELHPNSTWPESGENPRVQWLEGIAPHPRSETCYLNHVLWQMGMSTISELVLRLYTPDCWLLWYPISH